MKAERLEALKRPQVHCQEIEIKKPPLAEAAQDNGNNLSELFYHTIASVSRQVSRGDIPARVLADVKKAVSASDNPFESILLASEAQRATRYSRDQQAALDHIRSGALKRNLKLWAEHANRVRDRKEEDIYQRQQEEYSKVYGHKPRDPLLLAYPDTRHWEPDCATWRKPKGKKKKGSGQFAETRTIGVGANWDRYKDCPDQWHTPSKGGAE